MSKPKGKQSVYSAVKEVYPVLPVRFSALFLHHMVAKRIGRPEVFIDTCLRKLRLLKEEGSINFENCDKLRSLYMKLPVNTVN
jgi:hypothetical protein